MKKIQHETRFPTIETKSQVLIFGKLPAHFIFWCEHQKFQLGKMYIRPYKCTHARILTKTPSKLLVLTEMNCSKRMAENPWQNVSIGNGCLNDACTNAHTKYPWCTQWNLNFTWHGPRQTRNWWDKLNEIKFTSYKQNFTHNEHECCGCLPFTHTHAHDTQSLMT